LKKIIELNIRDSFTPSAVFIDGISRSGKAGVAVAISSLERTEHVQNKYIFDTIMTNYELGFLNKKAAIDQLITEIDFTLYFNYLGRNLNTNVHDWSSVLNSRDPSIYKQRMQRKDNLKTAKIIFDEIEKEKPMSINTCEELLLHRELFLEAFNNLFVVVVLRHPVEIVFSWHRTGRGERYGSDKRFIHPTFGSKQNPIPSFALSWSKIYQQLKPLDRVIKSIDYLYRDYFREKQKLTPVEKDKFHWVSFENFSENTETVLNDIASFLGTKTSSATKRMCNNQRFPRRLDRNEFLIKLKAIEHHASEKEYRIFKKLCEDYEKLFPSKFSISLTTNNSIEYKKDFNSYLSNPDFNKGKRIN